MDIQLERYYDRFDTNPNYPHYKKLLFRAKDIAQSAEMNELQDVLHKEITDLSTKILVNGQIVSGCVIKPTREENGFDLAGRQKYNYSFDCGEGIVFIDTYFVNVPQRTIDLVDIVPETFQTTLGIQVKYEIITEAQDPDLKNPALESKNYGAPGAGRLKVTGEWVFEDSHDPNAFDTYLPIFEIENGDLKTIINPNPWEKDILNMVAKYDRNANGNYVIEGYEASYLSKESDLGPFEINIADGNANVYGYNYETDSSRQIILPELVDFELKQGEPVNFNGDNTYETRHYPIRKVFRVSGQKEVQEVVNHGGYSGASDELQNQPVLSVLKVWQGNESDPDDPNNTVYTEGTDYIVNGDYIDWSPEGGAEPNPGDSYYVIYRYQYTETENNFSVDPNTGKTMGQIIDKTKIWLFGFAPNTIVSVDYDFVLQREDAIYLDAQGNLGFMVGLPDEHSPKAPVIDNKGTLLKIARVTLGADYDPIVTQDAQRVFKMADIQLLLDSIRLNEYNIAKLALKENLKDNQPTSIFKNSFVDDFSDDDLRDEENNSLGILNDALTVGGNLILDTNWENIYNGIVIDPEQDFIMSDTNTVSEFIEQPYWSKTRQINEYLFKAAPPATVSCNPRVYRWVSRSTYSRFVRSIQTSTRTVWRTRWGWWGWSSTTTLGREVVARRRDLTSRISTSSTPQIIPRINIRVWSKDQDFNSNENVKIYFDNKFVTTVQADNNGKVNTTFQVPSNSYSGTKTIRLEGTDSGVKGETLFQAIPLVRNVTETVTTWWRWVVRRTRWVWWNRDPVAQSFVPDRTTVIDGIRVFFDTLPTTNTTLVLCETEAGFPNKKKTLTSVTYTPDMLVQGDQGTYFQFKNKPTVVKGAEYAFIVICEDAIGNVRVAKLGERDKSVGKWLTSQPYNAGVFFNSSNNSTWSPIQDEDMQFIIYETTFKDRKVVPLTVVNVEDATDLMVVANSKIEEGTNVYFNIKLLDRTDNNEFKNVSAYTQIGLDEIYTGRVYVEAVLESNGFRTPYLEPDTILSVGKTSRTSYYTSRQFDFDSDGTIVDVYIDAFKPSNTNITIEYQDYDAGSDSFTWVAIPEVLSDSKPIGNDWVEKHYRIEGVTPPDNYKTRIRITLSTSNDKDRPVVGNLRASIQKI